mmetsp:Transcript_96105/g.256853  ORF Transcript_96105/g.256853 Transcript_96105/m.256853 type:complete len:398 (-) Transcript_96105:158-1351(-)
MELDALARRVDKATLPSSQFRREHVPLKDRRDEVLSQINQVDGANLEAWSEYCGNFGGEGGRAGGARAAEALRTYLNAMAEDVQQVRNWKEQVADTELRRIESVETTLDVVRHKTFELSNRVEEAREDTQRTTTKLVKTTDTLDGRIFLLEEKLQHLEQQLHARVTSDNQNHSRFEAKKLRKDVATANERLQTLEEELGQVMQRMVEADSRPSAVQQALATKLNKAMEDVKRRVDAQSSMWDTLLTETPLGPVLRVRGTKDQAFAACNRPPEKAPTSPRRAPAPVGRRGRPPSANAAPAPLMLDGKRPAVRALRHELTVRTDTGDLEDSEKDERMETAPGSPLPAWHRPSPRRGRMGSAHDSTPAKPSSRGSVGRSDTGGLEVGLHLTTPMAVKGST